MCSIDESSFLEKSEGLKPDWLGQSKLFLPRYSNIELEITLLKFFPRMGNR